MSAQRRYRHPQALDKPVRPADAKLKLVLQGFMVSGKNQQKVEYSTTKTGKVRRTLYPNDRFKDWRTDMAYQIIGQKPHAFAPMKGRLGVAIQYWPGDRVIRDNPGMLDALYHLFKYCNLIEDDKQFKRVYFNESPTIYDTGMRMEIEIEPISG